MIRLDPLRCQYDALSRRAAHYHRQGLPWVAAVSHAAVALPPGRKRDPAGFGRDRF
jgi:hypothetical protein